MPKIEVDKFEWDELTHKVTEYEASVGANTRTFTQMDAQIGRLWNQVGQMSKQMQDLININHELIQTIEDIRRGVEQNVINIREEGESGKDPSRPKFIPREQ